MLRKLRELKKSRKKVSEFGQRIQSLSLLDVYVYMYSILTVTLVIIKLLYILCMICIIVCCTVRYCTVVHCTVVNSTVLY